MRVFIFGIDGLTMRIMKPLMDKGIVPNFKSVYENCSSVLKSTIPPLTPPGWASIYTGKNPGKHRLFEFTRRNGYEYVTNTCWDYAEAPPFWKYLAEHGKKSVLLNIPMYYPPLKLQNCYSISGFNALESLDIYYPTSLKNEILEKVPNYRIDTTWHHQVPENKKEDYIKENLEITVARINAIKYLMNEKTWDFFFVVFTGTDRMQHFFWGDIVQGIPEVLEYYRLLDNAIGYVLNSLKREDFFFIVSDHGFRPIKKNVNLNVVLQQHGLLRLKESKEIPLNYMKIRKLVEKLGLTKGLKRIFSQKVIDKIHEHSRVEGVFSFKKIEMAHTKAFASSGTYGGICINLKGREPEGIVPESEYESVREDIIQVFSSLLDKDNNGNKVIKNVYKREDVYWGKYLQEMPDIVLLSETDYRFGGSIDKLDVFTEPKDYKNNQVYTGEHEMESVIILNQCISKETKEVSVLDIAPSILNIFGLPIPTSMDGRSLFEDLRKPVYIDESTGAIFEKQNREPSNIKLKLKKLLT